MAETMQNPGTEPEVITDDVATSVSTDDVHAGNEGGGEAATQDRLDPDLERRARAIGWKPEAEFVGPSKKWKPADEFIAFHDAVLPLVQRENKALRDKLERIERERSEERTEKAKEQKEREDLRRQSLVLERKQALENGDSARADEINDTLIDMKVADKVAAVAPKQALPDPEVNRIWTEFEGENEWVRDPDMQEVMVEQMTLMRQSGNTTVGRAFLDKAKDRVRRQYPERFTPAQRRSSAMADTGGSPGSSTTSRSWNDLKPDVRQNFEEILSEEPSLKDPQKMKASQARILANAPAEAFRR